MLSKLTILFAGIPILSMCATQAKYFVYVGTYGKGVYAYSFDTDNAKLQSIGLAGEVVNPSFLAADRDYRYLYAASEVEGRVNGAVAGFAIDRGTGALRFLNSQSSGGQSPCHVTVDHTGRMLIVANYGTGGVSAYPIERDGHIGAMSSLMTAEGSSVNPQRQKGPHAHEAVIEADNRRVYVPDLGLDEIRIYRLDPEHAKLLPNEPPFAKEQAGFGPRHMAFSPNGKYAYVVNELNPKVTVFSHNKADGSMHPVQTISTVPEGFSGESDPAEIRIDREGKFVYATNRGPGTVAVFAVNQNDGTLKQVQVAPTGGTVPRGFQLDPTGKFAFAGDQKSNEFVIFRIDPHSGKLTLTGQKLEVSSPVDFLFIPAK